MVNVEIGYAKEWIVTKEIRQDQCKNVNFYIGFFVLYIIFYQ